MKIKNYVVVRTQFDGIHNWDKCPFKEVSFLKYKHRHEIKITVKIETTLDRQIEFFMLKLHLNKIIVKLYGKEDIKILGTRSMEQIAKEIFNELLKTYGPRNYEIIVSEDGQNDGVIECEI
jgi:hypothetical protein